ncbi:STAS domain-containing protein [Spirillospora sp. NPDC000708]
MAAAAQASRAVSTVSVLFSAAGPWVLAEVRGELDVATAPAMLHQIGKVCAVRGFRRIALELSQVTFCDSSGINAIVRLHKYAGTAGGELVLLRPRPHVDALLTRTGIAGHLRVMNTLSDMPQAGPAAPSPPEDPGVQAARADPRRGAAER